MDWNLLLHILAGSHDIYALDMITKVSKAFWGYSLLGYVLVQDSTSISSSQALQQGSMGLILTTLILTAPPMADIRRGHAWCIYSICGNGAAIGASGAASHPSPKGSLPVLVDIFHRNLLM
ncbi:hypothetical protein [Xanthomonas arboricola]|uniref:hypothetical protein n=1 Tax=Xanthomonas arboricola TaxID=56448 RepID=UPI0012D3324B|nr:hypothetical protein [Xanthomonas arboricola]